MSDIQDQVRDAVGELIRSGAERGLQVAVFHDGTQVVDVAAGTDATGREITAATPVAALSTGKGLAATVVHVLAERGVLGYDTRIADVWPEFGVEGKETATVRHLLTHAVGLPALPEGVTADDLREPDAIAARLAASAPVWEPGTQVGYHAQTWGYLTGELVRRTAGRRISEVLRDEVAGPLGVADELYFGVPAAEQPRVARLEEAPGYADMVAMFGSPVPPTAELCNRADVLAADNPAGGVLSARAVARMYAALLGETGGVRLVGPDRLRELSAVAYDGPDAVMGMPTLCALGYGIGRPGERQPVRTVFGMPGVGGSAAWADTATGTAFAITTTRLHPGTAPALARIQELIA